LPTYQPWVLLAPIATMRSGAALAAVVFNPNSIVPALGASGAIAATVPAGAGRRGDSDHFLRFNASLLYRRF
jgi:membrane associated rhomboid family serine protease